MGRRRLLGAALLLAAAYAGQACAREGGEGMFSLRAPPGRRCARTEDIPLAGLELSAQERALLPYICWEGRPSAAEMETLNFRRGIPPGVNCTAVQWCDGDVCSQVCERGSVSLEPWLVHALRGQAALARSLPLCYTQLLGTHNSGITLADGYGNLDPYFQSFLLYIKWASPDVADAPLRTNDQWLSLTDQLRLGVRAVELDTHWIGGGLRIAHCGGLHVPQLNALVQALNLVAKLLRRRIRWDTETLGCVPSLSSIPAMEQRTLADALAEVRAWMDQPGNEQEFLVVYFDDQPDLAAWGVVASLQEDVLSAFPADWVYTTDDHEAAGEEWPAPAQLVAAGKRLLFVSGTDYGPAMRPLVFPRGQVVCRWTEPQLADVDPAPACSVEPPPPHPGRPPPGPPPPPRPLFDGRLTRISSCELEYGPLSNCDFAWRGSNDPVLDEDTLPQMLSCGLNLPAPDLLTPARAAAAVWSWAPGHPFEPGPQPTRLKPGGSSSVWRLLGLADAAPEAGDEVACAAISASDARWRAVPCGGDLPTACRQASAPLTSDAAWVLHSGPRGSCPEGSVFDLPRHPRANAQLAASLRDAGAPAAWLPLQAPDWQAPQAQLVAFA